MARERSREAPGLGGRLVVALLASALLLVVETRLGDGDVLRGLELQTLDWRFRLRGPLLPGGDVTLVMADDATVAGVGAWPLPREVVARAVTQIAAAGADVIVVNLLISEAQASLRPSTRALLEEATAALPPDAALLRRRLETALGAGGPDDALVAAIDAAARVITPYAFVLDPGQANVGGLPAWIKATAYRIRTGAGGPDTTPVLAPQGLLVPAPRFAAAGVSSGHVSLVLEADGSLRADLPAVAYAGDLYPSLAVEAARLQLGVPRERVAVQGTRGILIGERLLPTDELGRQLINHYGPDGSIPTFSLLDLLHDRIDPAALAGRIVILGASAAGAGDRFATPFTSRLPGSEFLATAIDNIIEGRSLVRNGATRALDALAVVVMALAAALLAGRRSPIVSLLAITAVLGVWAGVIQAAFVLAHVWLAALAPSAAALVAGVGVEGLRLADERQRRRRSERQRANLARYFAPAVVERLATSDAPAKLDRTQDAVVLFVDIVGFTRISEAMPPAEAMNLLRDFHTRVEQAVFAHGGMVDKFMGDGAMACFGVPDASPTAAADAIRAALALLVALEESAGDAAVQLKVGIGIHGGPVLMGDIGGAMQFQFTVIGDTVNVASRLESLTRQHDTPLIVSEPAMAAARAGLGQALVARFAPLPDLPIRGRQGTLAAWRLMD